MTTKTRTDLVLSVGAFFELVQDPTRCLDYQGGEVLLECVQLHTLAGL